MKEAVIRELENGLKVVYTRFPGIDTAYFTLMGCAGSNYELPNERGCAHFLEHLLFDGSRKYPTMEELRSVLLDVGGVGGGLTSREVCEFTAGLLKKDIKLGFEYLSELVWSPVIREKSIEREKKVITQEIKRNEGIPSRRLGFLLNELRFDDERYSPRNAGSEKDVESISKESIESFLGRNYVAQNFVLSVCSDVNKSEIFKLAQKYFSSVPSGQRNTPITFKKAVGLGIRSKNESNLKQAHLVVSYFAYEQKNEKRYVLKFVQDVLGGDVSSRFSSRIRQEEGIAYSVGASYLSYPTHGFFTFHSEFGDTNLREVFKILKSEIERIKKEPIQDAEFNRLRNNMIASYVYSSESPKAHAGYYARKVLNGNEKVNYKDVIEKYKGVTKNQIMQAANEIFSQEPKIAVLSKSLTEDEIARAWKEA